MESALALADEANRVIASNLSLDRVLVGSDRWLAIEKAFPCWTGTLVAYEEPGKKFGKTVEYADDGKKIKYVFEVPSQYVGEKDSILVSEYSDYKLEIEGNIRIIRAVVVDLIEKFPAEDGWYLADPKYGIPFGDSIDKSDSNARFLSRLEKNLSPVARGYYYYYGHEGRSVGLESRPSNYFGVAVVALLVSGVQFPDNK